MNAAGVSVTTITGSDLIDTLVGDASSTISGGGGNDIITGGSGNDTITGGDGDDVITPNAGSADSVDGGAGNDRIIIDTDADIASGNTVAGGDGTDTFAVTAVQTANAASDLRGVSGFEIFELGATGTESFAMSDFINNQTFTRVDFGQGGGGTLTVTNAPELITEVRLLAGPQADTLVFDRLVDNASNSLTIANRAANTAIDVTAITIADEETVTITTSAATSDLGIATLTAGDMTSLTISGAGDVQIVNQMTGTRMTSVDASGSTGATEIHLTGNVVAATMTGASGVDEFTGGLLADTITGNAGNDIIIGGAGADTITGDAGNDNINGGTGGDIVDVGAGTNTITIGATDDTGSVTLAATVALSGVDVYSSVAAADIVNLNGTGLTAVAATSVANTYDTDVDTNLANGLAENTYGIQRGDYVQSGATSGTGTFIFGAGGSDALFAFDSNGATNANDIEAIVLLGSGATVTTATIAGSSVVTLA
jgi:Ca2+-binding RTX toxin-like protein